MAPRNRAKEKALEKPEPKFTAFNKLPLELRDKIWKLSFPSTNLITLSVHPYSHSAGNIKLSAEYKIPGQFQACSESRKVAEDVYKKIFESHLGYKGNGVWFNPDCDALVLKRTQAVQTAMEAAVDESLTVRFLAFSPDTLHYLSPVAWISQVLESFGNVELVVQLKRMGRAREHCAYIERKLQRYWDNFDVAGNKRPEFGILMPQHFEARIAEIMKG